MADSKHNQEDHRSNLIVIQEQLGEAIDARKCHQCGCFQDAVKTLEGSQTLRPHLDELLSKAGSVFEPQRYDCLGCDVCWPAVALNAAVDIDPEIASHALCPTDEPTERKGWPPLPGDYTVLRYHAPVAVCTLTSLSLLEAFAGEVQPDVAMVGSLQTENLGIERLIKNVTANTNIRFLVVCGDDSRQRIGHLPGQSLIALAEGGTDERGRIVGAKGKRPLLKNIPYELIEHFRSNVEVIDLIGCNDMQMVLETIDSCSAQNLGSAEPPPELAMTIPKLTGYIPERMISDPAGYFVVYVDRINKKLVLEHYQNNGILDIVIDGLTPPEIVTPVVERKLISRLDHAAYLGRELARAEASLLSEKPYIQDKAPEKRFETNRNEVDCGCSEAC